MMSDLDILRRLIRKDILASVEDNYGKQSLVLKETASQQTAYSLKVHNVPNDTIAFKADKFPAPEMVFQGGKGECKRADFIIITSTPQANWIVYIEIKRGQSARHEEVVQQLKGAECLVAYCRAVGRVFWQEPNFLKKSDYQQRFVSVKNINGKNISVNKRPTRISPESGLHNSPDKMLKISAPGNNRLQFNQLVGNP